LGKDAKLANVTLSEVDITGATWCGALAAYVYATGGGGIIIQNCHASGTLQKSGAMSIYGGLIGQIISTSNITYVYDCSCSCDLDMTNATSGNARGCFIGNAQYTVFGNCSATGSLMGGDYGDSSMGGFAGSMSNCTLSFCSATGNITGGNTLCGGLVGNAIQNIDVDSCYATGNIIANSIVGGFFGNIDSDLGSPCSVTDCYAWGNVTANTDFAGGFVAVADDPGTTFTNCYSIGLVTNAGANGGGFDADSYVTTTFNDCYWDTEISGWETTDGSAEGKITTWLKTNPNYPDTWDFDNIWYQEYTAAVPAVPGYTETINVGYQPEEVCIYADGIPMGVYDVNNVDSNDILNFNEDDYSVIIAGINYYSIYESFPLIPAGHYSSIKDVKIDFYESMGCHVGVSLDDSVDWIFSYDDFATAIDPLTEIKAAPFVWGSTREPIIYLQEWDPVPMSIRGIYPRINVTFE